MPELPEIECLTRAVSANLAGDTFVCIEFFRDDLRGLIPKESLRRVLCGQVLLNVVRRSKYLIMETSNGCGLFHMGMTGNLLLRSSAKPELAHTHAIFTFSSGGKGKKNGKYLHFVDPRRFGRLDVSENARLEDHPLLKNLGPEPLILETLGAHLFEASRSSSRPIKNFIMDQAVVVGVGNIYASEALFRARLNPFKAAGRVPLNGYNRLALHIKQTLTEAIAAGGTTLRDFKDTAGEPGYFAISLSVYGKSGKSCLNCGQEILQKRQAGRSTFYCPNCQK